MSEKFKTGEIVRLKSGGPTMTFGGEAALTGEAICYWFHGTERKCETFPFEALELLETE
jgi:uncharacterized protein YodC (DUF2158 family)